MLANTVVRLRTSGFQATRHHERQLQRVLLMLNSGML
jgi:hypothetical protein